MKTTELISHWSMSGAGRDVAGRFRSSVDIREAFTAHADTEQQAPDRGELLVKRADAEDWAPLA